MFKPTSPEEQCLLYQDHLFNNIQKIAQRELILTPFENRTISAITAFKDNLSSLVKIQELYDTKGAQPFGLTRISKIIKEVSQPEIKDESKKVFTKIAFEGDSNYIYIPKHDVEVPEEKLLFLKYSNNAFFQQTAVAGYYGFSPIQQEEVDVPDYLMYFYNFNIYPNLTTTVEFRNVSNNNVISAQVLIKEEHVTSNSQDSTESVIYYI